MPNNLIEDTRSQLISKSRNAGAYTGDTTRGKNRFERKKYSKIATQVKSYNQIDMNKFFKQDLLEVNIPIAGETAEYITTARLNGVVAEIAKNIKNNDNKFEYRTVLQSLTKIFNTSNIYVKCTCLTGDTKIKLLDGTSDTIENLATRYENGEKLYVYAVDEQGDFKPGEVLKAWKTGIANKLIKVTLDNGEEIKTTADHLYMLRDGTYKRADALQTGQSLMPLYTDTTKNGYETVKFNSTGKYHSTYKVVGEHYYAGRITEKIEQAQKEHAEGKNPMRYDVAIHHSDFNKSNNYPENLEIMTGYEHWMYHANTIKRLWNDPEFRKAASERSIEWMTWLNQNPTEAMTAARKSKRNIEQLTSHNYDPEWLEKHSVAMSKFMTEYWKNMSEDERTRRSKIQSEVSKAAWEQGCFDTPKRKAADEARRAHLHTPEMEALAANGIRNYWTNLSEEDRTEVIKQRKQNLSKGQGWNKGKHLEEWDRKKKSEALLNRSQEEKQAQAIKVRDTKMLHVFSKLLEDKKELTEENYELYRKEFFPKSPRLLKHFNSLNEVISYFKLNHKIVAIEEIILEEAIPVYDISVKDFHNFAVDAGIILHNCDDFKYRFKHWSIVNNYGVDDTASDPGPGKGIVNPMDDKGRGCKHILVVLANQDWLMKVCSVIHNYINYAQENMLKPFQKVIFPKLYGISIEDAIEKDLVPEDTKLDTEKHIIDVINDWAKNRGKYKAGSNKNPVTGTGGGTAKSMTGTKTK